MPVRDRQGGPRADWTSVYYHRADARGIGFDRTPSGSNAVSLYAPPVRDRTAAEDPYGQAALIA